MIAFERLTAAIKKTELEVSKGTCSVLYTKMAHLNLIFYELKLHSNCICS